MSPSPDEAFETALQCVLAARLELENAVEDGDQQAFAAAGQALDLAVDRLYAIPRPVGAPGHGA